MRAETMSPMPRFCWRASREEGEEACAPRAQQHANPFADLASLVAAATRPCPATVIGLIYGKPATPDMSKCALRRHAINPQTMPPDKRIIAGARRRF